MQTRTANAFSGTLFALALLLVLFSGYVALVYHGDLDIGVSFVTSLDFGVWIAAFAVALAVIFVVLLILYLVPRSPSFAMAPPAPAGAVSELRISCPACQQEYIIDDTGERPLLHTCPHCGTTHTLEAEGAPAAQPPPEATAEAAAPEEAPAPAPRARPQPPVVERMEGGVAAKYMVMRCGDCKTQFEVPFTTERPVVTTCANCGRRGILR